MRRLTLILSDLYLPEEVGRRSSPLPRPTAELPALDVAAALRGCAATRRRLARAGWPREPVPTASTDLPIAQTVRADGSSPLPGRDRLARDAGAPRSAARSRAAHGPRAVASRSRRTCELPCAEFARAFGPQYALHDAGERGFLPERIARRRASAPSTRRACWVPTSVRRCPRARSRGIATARGGNRNVAARCGAQHGARAAAEAALCPRCGCGAAELDAVHGVRAAACASGPRIFVGGDPLIAALNRAGRRSRAPSRPPSDWSANRQPAAPHVVVEFAPLSGPRSMRCQSLEARWFAHWFARRHRR